MFESRAGRGVRIAHRRPLLSVGGSESSPRYFFYDKDLRQRRSFFYWHFWVKCTLVCTLPAEKESCQEQISCMELGNGKSQERWIDVLYPILHWRETTSCLHWD
jgi:hypothetical protein